jgi:hypothetical protein
VAARTASYSNHKNARFFPEQLNSFRRKRIVAKTATLLLEVFLDCLETSPMELAHAGPPLLVL